MKKLMLVFMMLCFIQVSYGQFGNILKRATNRAVNKAVEKTAEKVADKVVEVVSDEIARRAFKSIDAAVDDMMKERYQDSLGQEVDWEEAGKAYGDFLSGMNKSIGEIPDQYVFDIVNEIEMIDDKGKKNTMKMMYSKEGHFMGFETEEKKSKSTIIFDIENDAFVMFNEDKKGEKTGQVMPSMLNLAASLSSSVIEKEVGEYKVEKIGKGGTYAGYKTIKYIVTSDNYITESHIAQDFPIEWKQAYMEFSKKFSPAMINTSSDEEFGMVLFTKTKSTKKKSKVTSSEVIKVSLEKLTFNKSEYNFPGAIK